MSLPDDIKIYLPQYLNEKSTKDLLKNLEDYYKENTTDKIYSDCPSKNTIYQGDGINNLSYYFFNNKTKTFEEKKVPSIILSNTCDISLDNSRKYPIGICYAPLIPLQKFYKLLLAKFEKERVKNVIQDIKRQKNTDIFYLPKGGKLQEDYITFFSRISSIDNSLINRKNLNHDRLFSLSNFGFYIFLLKLSINFTRIQENVDRSSFNE